ncbi:hypothetical protein K8S19_00890 [bacterium]|nr:hypothetical protein [bacterium]
MKIYWNNVGANYSAALQWLRKVNRRATGLTLYTKDRRDADLIHPRDSIDKPATFWQATHAIVMFACRLRMNQIGITTSVFSAFDSGAFLVEKSIICEMIPFPVKFAI